MTPEDQKVIEEVLEELADSYGTAYGVAKKLRALLPPEPERIGGLTMDEWKMLAKLEDVLVEVGDSGIQWYRGYLRNILDKPDEPFNIYHRGTTSATWTNSKHFKHCRLIEDTRWRLNTGYQPVPDGVEVEIITIGSDGSRIGVRGRADDFDWEIDPEGQIVTYRIIGVKE